MYTLPIYKLPGVPKNTIIILNEANIITWANIIENKPKLWQHVQDPEQNLFLIQSALGIGPTTHRFPKGTISRVRSFVPTKDQYEILGKLYTITKEAVLEIRESNKAVKDVAVFFKTREFEKISNVTNMQRPAI